MLVKTPKSKKGLYHEKEKERKAFELKLNAKYTPLFKSLNSDTESCYFTYDQVDFLISKVLDKHTTRRAYKDLKKAYSLTQSYIEKAYKRKSIFLSDIIESRRNHATFKLLKQHNFCSRWWIKAYHEEAVSTGLARLSRNIEIALRLEKVKILQEQNNELIKRVSSLEAKLQLSDKNWFTDVALPMYQENYSLADIATKTGQKKDTIRKRLKRCEQLKQRTCPAKNS